SGTASALVLSRISFDHAHKFWCYLGYNLRVQRLGWQIRRFRVKFYDVGFVYIDAAETERRERSVHLHRVIQDVRHAVAVDTVFSPLSFVGPAEFSLRIDIYFRPDLSSHVICKT